MKYDLYRNQLGVHGLEKSERDVNHYKDRILRKVHESPSCKKVLLNGIEAEVVITSTTDVNEKHVKALPYEEFFAGDMIYWKDLYWLIMDVDDDDTVNCKGTMRRCSVSLRWQDSEGNIYETPCVLGSSSGTLSDGNLTDGRLMTVGARKKVLMIPFSEKCRSLLRDKRIMLVDNNDDITVFKIVEIDTLTYVYNGHGYIAVTIEEDVLNVEKDNLRLYICDYIERENPNIPPIFQDPETEIVTYDSSILLGYSLGTTLTAIFTPESEDLVPVWTVNCNDMDKVIVKDEGYSINIYVSDKSMLGEFISVTLSEESGKYPSNTVELEVVSIY